MSTARQVLRGGAAMGIGQVASQGLSFVRNVIVARLVSPADFGIAATFVMAVSLFDMASNFDPAILLIQAEDGGDERFQNTAHTLEILRGLVNSALLAAIAWPTARLFRIPETGWAFFLLALVPLIRALGHLDRMRVQRDLVFRPFVAVEVYTHAALLVLAWPACIWFRDYRAMLLLLIGQSIGIAFFSHLMAQRPYRWAWDRKYLGRFLTFGWPLLINGLIMFLITQGDRAAIGAKYTMTQLGIYSVALTLTTMPTMLVFRVVGPIVLPLLARVQARREEFLRRYDMVVAGLCAIGIVITVPLIVAGGPMVRLIFGERYAGAGTFMTWLAAAQAVKFVRGAPVTATLALGDSHNQMISNVWRISGVAAAAAVAFCGGSLAHVAACSLFGEIVSLVVSVSRLEKLHGVPLIVGIRPTVFAVVTCGLASIATAIAPSGLPLVVALLLALAIASIALLAMLWLFPEFRSGSRMAIGIVVGQRRQPMAVHP